MSLEVVAPSALVSAAAALSPNSSARGAQSRLVPTKAIAVGAMIFLGWLPLAIKLGRSLLEREQYQFFPVLLIGAAFCAWERWRDRTAFDRGLPRVAVGVLTAALLVLVAGVLLWVRSAAGVALILILAGMALRVGGWALLHAMLPIGLLLATIVPPPGRQDQVITLRLQHLAVVGSSRLLDGLHVPHVQGGNVLEIPGRRLLVEQACSGINSLMSVVAFVMLWGVWKRRAWWRVVLLLPMAVVFVIAGNVLRITIDAWLKVRWNIDVLSGTPHEMLGLVLFAGCVGVTLSFDGLIGLVDQGERRNIDAKPQAAKTAEGFVLGMTDWGIAIAFLIVGVWSQGRVGSAWAASALGSDARFDLPASLVGWEKVNREVSIVERPQTEASQSFIWQYRRGDLIASVAIDYPFAGYHELTTCYRTSGWTLLDRVNVPGKARVTMSKPAGLGGMLEFTAMDEHGEWVGAPEKEKGSGVMLELEIAGRYGRAEPTYQMQTLTQSYTPMSDAQRGSVDQLFDAARGSLRTQLLKQLPRK